MAERYLTGADLAGRLGVSKQYVYKLHRRGDLVRRSDKKFDVNDPTNAATISEIKERRGAGMGSTGGANGETASPAPAPPSGVSVDDRFLSYTEWKRRREAATARQAELALEERLGNLADISIVLAIIEAHKHGLVANFVDSIQRQAMQICSMVGAEGKERIVEEYLEKENKRRLEEADRTAAAVAERLKRGTKNRSRREGED